MGEKGNGGAKVDDTPRTHEGTQERPGTGVEDAKPEGPDTPGGRARGQITDEKGEYGPVRHSEPAGEPTGDMKGQMTEPAGPKVSRRPGIRPGPARGQITDESGRYGPERRSR